MLKRTISFKNRKIIHLRIKKRQKEKEIKAVILHQNRRRQIIYTIQFIWILKICEAQKTRLYFFK